jgi:hypothetical protein
MPSFARAIRDAYQEILEREADPGGLASWDHNMNLGMSEAEMREALLRSPEYAARHPGLPLSARLGLNAHIPSNAILEDIAGNLRMRWVRIDFDWFRIQPEQASFHWEEWDRLVRRASELGLEVLATLAYTPPWASPNPGNPRISDPPASTAFWTDFVREAVGRYRDRVRYWQFWNEPNITQFWTGSMALYRTQILEAGVAAARPIHPGLRVVAPGLSNIRDWRAWFTEAMKARDVIDVVSHHNYQTSGREVVLELERDRPTLPSLRTLIRQNGVEDRPFWITETGLRSSEGDQRRYYEDVAAVLREREWVERLFFFHYWDGPGAGNGGFGIVNEDFSPKPAYRFLQSALAPAALRAAGNET